jgi:hypothetical protein
MANYVDVKDNFLDPHHFLEIQRIMMSDKFPWYTNPNGGVAYNNGGDGMYFVHHFYYQQPYDQSRLSRVKGNMYPSMKRRVFHDWHTDSSIPHKGGVFCINTNNGFTCFKNGKVKSVENRLILFDPSVPHRSSTCTDQTCRVNINFNYYV